MITINLLRRRKTLETSGRRSNFDATVKLKSDASLRDLKEKVIQWACSNKMVPPILADNKIATLDVDLVVYKPSESDPLRYIFSGSPSACSSSHRDQFSTAITRLSNQTEFIIFCQDIYIIQKETESRKVENLKMSKKIVPIKLSILGQICNLVCPCVVDSGDMKLEDMIISS